MSQILAVDASTEVCSVAVNDDQTVVSRYCDTPKSHSKVLLPLIDEVLMQASIGLSEIDALAVTCGPGSFTGIRIGMGIVQGLSYAAEIPLIGVNTLSAMAVQYSLACEKRNAMQAPQQLITALDARMGEIYWAVYNIAPEQQQEQVSARVSAPAELYAWLQQQPANGARVGIGHGWSVPELTTYVEQTSVMQSVDAAFKPHAEGVLYLGRQLFSQNKSQFKVGTVEPVYLRNEITWQKRKRIRQP